MIELKGVLYTCYFIVVSLERVSRGNKSVRILVFFIVVTSNVCVKSFLGYCGKHTYNVRKKQTGGEKKTGGRNIYIIYRNNSVTANFWEELSNRNIGQLNQ